MIDWIADNAGVTGLAFFFLIFIGIVIWAFRPGAKETIESYKYIPLKGDKE